MLIIRRRFVLGSGAIGALAVGLIVFSLATASSRCARADASCDAGDLEHFNTGLSVTSGGSISTVGTAIAARTGNQHAVIAPTVTADRVSSLPDFAGQILAVPTPGALGLSLLSSGAGTQPSWTAGTQYVLKTADETISSSTTLQADDALFFTLEANKSYMVDVFVLMSTGGTEDWKFQFTGPASVTFDGYVHDGNNVRQFTEASAAIDTFSVTEGVWHFKVSITNGASAGNFTLTWAQNTSGATNTTVKQGSVLRWAKVN